MTPWKDRQMFPSGPNNRTVSRAFSALLLTAPLLLAARGASAKPAYLKAVGEYYGPFLPKALNNCGLCHLPSTTGKAPVTLADFPHNAYGKRLAVIAEELRKQGQRADLPSRFRATAKEDSDGDGISNEGEILAGRQPGDGKDKPTPPEVAAVEKARPRFLAFLNQYRWRPFDPVQRPAVPRVKSAAGLRNPVDLFLQAEREKQGLQPVPEAPKEILLRRVTLDLTGLSPTPTEVRAFLADHSPNAYEKVVDRLLASPAYGERWGRHWMDVWRYSDWAGWGEQVRDSQPHIWKWRDWIVESLNADKGYDRMVQEMLAADELEPTDPSALRATGFLVRNFKLLSREKWLEDTVDHTGQAFLGLTVGCARCHDHMYDPITQKEYYRLRAVFEPHEVRQDPVPGELDTKKDGLPRVYDAKPDAPTYLFVRGDERRPVKDDPLKPGIIESLGGKFEVKPVALPLTAVAPEKQPFVIELQRKDAARKVDEARKALQAAGANPGEVVSLALQASEAAQASLEAVLRAEALEDGGKKGSAEWSAAAEAAVRAQREQAVLEATFTQVAAARALDAASKAGKPAPVQKAAEALKTADAALVAAKKAAEAPVNTAYKPRVAATYPATSTGRRTALARWLTDTGNPLTARVAVNQIWLRHWGSGLEPTVADFGRNGAPPTHPQLLDWLAAELMANGWRMKPLHRLIVTSSAYRMASTGGAANAAKDPDNRYYWRMNVRRLDAEVVRDNVLFVAGQLDRKMGGPDIDQNLGLSVKRRTIYFRHAMEKEMVFTTLFDGPSVVECYRRKETIVPQQALALANSEIALVQSRLLARELDRSAGPDSEQFARELFLRVLARPAKPAEVAECARFLKEQAALLRAKAGVTQTAGAAWKRDDAAQPAPDPALRAREGLALVLLNHNDFVSVR